jgi:hypothetical protein
VTGIVPYDSDYKIDDWLNSERDSLTENLAMWRYGVLVPLRFFFNFSDRRF